MVQARLSRSSVEDKGKDSEKDIPVVISLQDCMETGDIKTKSWGHPANLC